MSKAPSNAEPAVAKRRTAARSSRAASRSAAAAAGPARTRKPLPPAAPGQTAQPSAQRRAAAILEVLAGEQTAAQAAHLLGISVMHYYLLERRALEGLVAACAPRPKGPPGPSAEQELSQLRRELDRSRRECLRQAALVRATRRAIGFPVAATASAKEKAEPAGGKRTRRRRTTVRALRAARSLRQNSSGPETADVVEKSSPEETASPGAGHPPSPAGSDQAAAVPQEAKDGAQRQKAGGHGACRAALGIGVGQAAADGPPGDAGG